jgi:hypothetical protein
MDCLENPNIIIPTFFNGGFEDLLRQKLPSLFMLELNIMERIVKKQAGMLWIRFIIFRIWTLVGSCKHDDKPLGSIKSLEFLTR